MKISAFGERDAEVKTQSANQLPANTKKRNRGQALARACPLLVSSFVVLG